MEAITILAQPRLVARLAGDADGGVLAAGVAFEVVAELPAEDCPGTSGTFLAGGACRHGRRGRVWGGGGAGDDGVEARSPNAGRERGGEWTGGVRGRGGVG